MYGVDGAADDSQKEEALRVLHSEINIIGKLRHPNVLPLLGVCAYKLNDGPFSCKETAF